MCSDLAGNLPPPRTMPDQGNQRRPASALYPQKRATSEEGWKTASAAGGFSALSLLAHELYKELSVPIGILLSAHSNTRVEAFTPRQATRLIPLKVDEDLIHDADPLTKQGLNAFTKYYADLKAWQDEPAMPPRLAASAPTAQASRIAGMWRGLPVLQRQDCPRHSLCHSRRNLVPEPATAGTDASSGPHGSAGQGMEGCLGMPGMPFISRKCNPRLARSRQRRLADVHQVQHKFFVENRRTSAWWCNPTSTRPTPGASTTTTNCIPGCDGPLGAGQAVRQEGCLHRSDLQRVQVSGRKVTVSFEKESSLAD